MDSGNACGRYGFRKRLGGNSQLCHIFSERRYSLLQARQTGDPARLWNDFEKSASRVFADWLSGRPVEVTYDDPREAFRKRQSDS